MNLQSTVLNPFIRHKIYLITMQQHNTCQYTTAFKIIYTAIDNNLLQITKLIFIAKHCQAIYQCMYKHYVSSGPRVRFFHWIQ